MKKSTRRPIWKRNTKRNFKMKYVNIYPCRPFGYGKYMSTTQQTARAYASGPFAAIGYIDLYFIIYE